MNKDCSKEYNLGLVVFDSAKDLGEKVNNTLLEKYKLNPKENTFILGMSQNFFEDGHLKTEIQDTVRGKNLFFLTDIGNYSVTYKMHGFENHASPNDLFFQLKDAIGACNSHAKSINVISPLLYNGRQHRRITRENLSCASSLRELDNIHGLKSFNTFDAHDPGVAQAVRNMEFNNYPTSNVILESFINNTSPETLKNIIFVAPDNGASARRNLYLNSFNSPYIQREAGSFVKQRDYNKIVDGKNPIISHDYSGNPDVKGKIAIVTDDMISSGGSMFDVIDTLHEMGIEGIYIMVTYALFTKGVDKFDEYYEKGLFDAVYTTNLSYIPEEYKSCKWLKICDCSHLIADIVYNINNDESVSELIHDKTYPIRLLERKMKK